MTAPIEPRPWLPLTTIVYPTDFSETSRYAFQVAAALAREQHARLIVVHVAAPAVYVGEAGPITLPLAEQACENLLAKLEEFSLLDPQVEVEHRLEMGDPVELLLEVAEETACDLIVMGTHGRRGLGRLLMGSVAEQLVRKAPCPVLTVKVPTTAEKTSVRRTVGAAN